MCKRFFALEFPYNLYTQKTWFWAFFAPNKIFGGSLWPNLQTGEMIVRTCVREFKSTERCFFREYDFQLQDANLLWLWDKWNFAKWKFLWCFFRHDTLKSKSDRFIEVFPPHILGRCHEYIEVLNPNFSADESKNSRFSLCLKK